MNWKDMLGETLKRVEDIEKFLRTVMAQELANSKKLQRIEKQLQSLHREKNQSVEQMADRLIQMSMVQRGESREASVHRRTAPGTSQEEPTNLWGELPDGAQWPPKGVEVVARL